MFNLFKKGNFAKVFFHDIKNKLLTIKVNLYLILHKPLPEEKKQDLLQKVYLTAEQTIDMVQDFLDFEKYKSSKFLKHESFDLGELLEEIIDELDLDAQKNSVKILYVKPKERLPIKANREWLKKALLNIIHNSIKYNKENGRVFINVHPEKRGYLLVIKDTGIGISRDHKEKIFKKYFSSDNKNGTGIGLNMAKVVIESHGGTIVFDSEENKGSVFYIYLPKISRKIKRKYLALALGSAVIAGTFIFDYYYCLIPQKMQYEYSGDVQIIKLENGIVARAKTDDKFKILAYRNLFNTKTKTIFKIFNADMTISSNHQPLKVITPKTEFKNLGTEFETVGDSTSTAVSVYKGAIGNKNIKVEKNQGLLVKNKPVKVPLPTPVDNLHSIDRKEEIEIRWSSDYNRFKLVASMDKNFKKAPVLEFKTSQKRYIFKTLNDGIWYINVHSENENLYSLPKTIKILSLINYYKGLKSYKNNDIDNALSYLYASVATVNKADFRPYWLLAKILFNIDGKRAFSLAKEAYEISKNEKTASLYAKLLYKNKEYKKLIETFKNELDTQETNRFLALSYYKLKDYKNAKKYIYKTLEENPHDTKLKSLLKKIQNDPYIKDLL